MLKKKSIFTFYVLISALLFSVNGTFRINFDQVILENDNILGKDINAIGNPKNLSSTIDFNLIDNIGKINYIFTIKG